MTTRHDDSNETEKQYSNELTKKKVPVPNIVIEAPKLCFSPVKSLKGVA